MTDFMYTFQIQDVITNDIQNDLHLPEMAINPLMHHRDVTLVFIPTLWVPSEIPLNVFD